MGFYFKFNVDYGKMHSFDDSTYDYYNQIDDELISLYGEIIDDDGKNVGSIKGYYAHNDGSFLSRSDNLSGDCCFVAETICDIKTGAVRSKYFSERNFSERIFVLDQIVIDKEHRGKGIASTIIKNLPEVLNNQFDEDEPGFTIFLCASAMGKTNLGFDSEEYKKEAAHLVQFYKKHGYKLIKDNVMFYKD